MTDFRYLNVRIAKNNLAYPLLKDTFSMLGSSKCEVLLVLNLKDTFYSLRLSGNSQKILWNTPLFWQDILSISEDAYEIKHFPLYMVILYQCNSQLSSKQKILWSNHGWSSVVYSLKEFSYAKIRFIKGTINEWIENIQKKCQLFRTNFNCMGNEIFIQNRRVCMKPLRSRLEAFHKITASHYGERM